MYKKIAFLLLIFSRNILQAAHVPIVSSYSIEQNKIDQSQKYRDVILFSSVFLASSWLTHKQIPRLTGSKVEFNAPLFTKTRASIFFIIGVTGAVVSTKKLLDILTSLYTRKVNNQL